MNVRLANRAGGDNQPMSEPLPCLSREASGSGGLGARGAPGHPLAHASRLGRATDTDAFILFAAIQVPDLLCSCSGDDGSTGRALVLWRFPRATCAPSKARRLNGPGWGLPLIMDRPQSLFFRRLKLFSPCLEVFFLHRPARSAPFHLGDCSVSTTSSGEMS